MCVGGMVAAWQRQKLVTFAAEGTHKKQPPANGPAINAVLWSDLCSQPV